MNNIEKKNLLSKEKVKAFMMETEKKIGKLPNAVYGDKACPLKHTYGDGCYIREITMPKGMLLTSKIHKKKHPYFILKGDVSVLTDDGIVRIKAPFSGITEAGTKRVLYMHEETVWATVHVTKETELKKIEEEVIAKTFEDVLPTREEILKFTEV